MGALRQNATLLALLAGALGLGGYLVVSGRRGEEPGPGAPLLPPGALASEAPDGGEGEKGAALLLGLQARAQGEITTLSLRRHEVAGRGRYWLDGPSIHERADDSAGEALYAALTGGRALRRLPGALGDGRRYGLDDAGWAGRIVLGGGRALRLGADAPGELVYAAWEGQRDVLLVEARLLERARAGREGYRRQALLPDDLEADPRRLGLGPLTLERRPSSWIVSDGRRRARARIEEVRAILDLLRTGRPLRMLDGGGLPYSGDFPALAAPVLLRPGEVVSAPWTLRVDGIEELFYGLRCPEVPDRLPDGGAPSPAGYAVRADGARLCLRAEDMARLEPAYEALRERRLLPFPPREVTRLRIGPAQLTGGGGRWAMDGRPADGGAMLAYLDALGAQDGAALAPGGPGPVTPAGPALAPLVLETEAGDQVSLRAGTCAGGPCVQRDDEQPLSIPPAALALLRPDPLRFLPRSLLGVPPQAVTAVALERRGPKGAEVEQAERRGGAWALVRPASAPADGVHLGRLLSLLSDLRAERWVAAAGAPPEGPGAVRLRVRTGGGEQVLLLGPPSPSGCQAAAGTGGPVGLLGRELCEALSRRLAARDLLLLDEARLREVALSGSAGRRVLARTARGYLLNGRPLGDAAPLLQALRRLGRGEPAGYGPAGPAAPLLTVEVRHDPLPLAAPPDSTVAPPMQRLRVYRVGRGLTARLDGRDVTYQLDCSEADLRPLR